MTFRRAVPAAIPLALTLVALAAFAAGGCSGDGDRRPGEPLVDGAHRPDVLTEARLLEPPPSDAGNRFVKGWWPWQRNNEPLVQLALAPVARLQGVQLEPRSRRLVLEASSADRELPADVRVRVAGRASGEGVTIQPRTEIQLPADLPLGRFAIDLEVGETGDFGVIQAALTPSLPAGEVAFEGADVVQSGSSMVVFSRPVAPGAELLGRFEPPDGAADGQRFELLVESGGETRQAFAWTAGGWSFLAGRARDFVVPLEVPEGIDAAFARVKLLAIGEGPPARWAGLRLARADSEGGQPAGPPAAAAEAPQTEPPVEIPQPPRLVIFYILDALRADHVGFMGAAGDLTPTLDRLAAEGAVFERHFSLAPNTVPAMKTLFAGQVPMLLGGLQLPTDGPPTLAQRFLMRGARTSLLTGNGNVSAWRGLSRGFQYAPPSLHFERTSQWTDANYNDNAERVHAAALKWLDSLKPEAQAFLHLQTIHPHNPYDPPAELARRFTAGIDSTLDGGTRTLLDIKRQKIEVDEADQARLQALYRASVAYNDRELARFMEALAERYAPGEVLLVISSDHGEELFDHGGVLHGYTLYDEQLHVPLLVWWPGVIEPRRIGAATDHLDLHHTFALLTGEGEGLEDFGHGLWPHLLTGEGRDKDIQFGAASALEGGIFMARSPRYKLIWAPRTATDYGSGQGLGRDRDAEHVYDLVNDPGETVNLAGYDIPEVDWLRERLKAWVEVGKQLETGVDPGEMDEQTRRSLKALGYLN